MIPKPIFILTSIFISFNISTTTKSPGTSSRRLPWPRGHPVAQGDPWIFCARCATRRSDPITRRGALAPGWPRRTGLDVGLMLAVSRDGCFIYGEMMNTRKVGFSWIFMWILMGSINDDNENNGLTCQTGVVLMGL